MTIFNVKKGIDGILSALFVAFTERIIPDEITPKCQPFQLRLENEIINIGEIDKHDTDRVKNALFNYAGNSIIRYMNIVLTSDRIDIYTVVFRYAYKILQKRRDISDMLADEDVMEFRYEFNKINFEKHRIEGFLRFNETVNGVLYAPFSPDNNIIELVAPHFLSRLPRQPFIIHDVKRKRIAISDGFHLRYDITDKTAVLNLSKNEKDLLSLWKKYFKSVNVKERKNTAQQDNFMPNRYRKYMPETYED
ncbi:MAG: TIGR03915 family putative DNA repair protein [Clostridia bacterium]|nr:TIGR03915 family putative DNA repair protein [Clostridia bacterium]